MAKQSHKIVVDTVNTGNTNMVSVAIPSDWKAEAHGFTITADQLTPAVVAYLLANGFTQSITDAGALSAKDKDGLSDDAVKALLADRRGKKYAAILAGTIRSGGTRGARIVGRDKVERDVQIFYLEQSAAKQTAAGKPTKLPTKAADLSALIEKAMSVPAFANMVKAETDRRMSEMAEATTDLGDIFA